VIVRLCSRIQIQLYYAHRPLAIVVDGVNGIELLARAHHDPARQHGRDIL